MVQDLTPRLGSRPLLFFLVFSLYLSGLQERKFNMMWFAERRAEWLAVMGDHVHDSITFVDNHDLPRWLHADYGSVSSYK